MGHIKTRIGARSIRVRAGTALALCMAAPWAAAQDAPAPPAEAAACALSPGPTRTVTRILDGETVALDDGSEVRLIGALAPRARDANAAAGAWPLEEAARTALAALTLGKRAALAYGTVRKDRYGRQLAHLFITEAGARTWVQGELLRMGLARAYALPLSGVCLAELLAHESLARRQMKGLWALPLYAPKPAAKTYLLAAGRSTFQIATGKVVAVSRTKSAAYLNFGSDWTSDFTVRIPRAVLKANPQWSDQLESLKDRTIEVRGWIERRGGPLISITQPGEIALLAGEGDDSNGEAPAPSVAEEIPQAAREPAATAPAAGGPAHAPENENRPEHEAPGDVDL